MNVIRKSTKKNKDLAEYGKVYFRINTQVC